MQHPGCAALQERELTIERRRGTCLACGPHFSAAVGAEPSPWEAAAILTQAIKDPRNAPALPNLGRGLAAVAARLEPEEAAQAAATLLQAISQAVVHSYRSPSVMAAVPA